MFKKLVFLGVFLPAIVCAEVSLPEQIKPPGGSRPVLTVHAKGKK